MKNKKKIVDNFLNESVVVKILDKSTNKKRVQSLKKRNLIDKVCIYTDSITGLVNKGKIIGINEENGDLIVVGEKDNSYPDPKKEFLVIL